MTLKYDVIWSILVSKEVSGPQQSHLLNQLWLDKCFEIKMSFINFENPLYFEVRKGGLGESTFQYPSEFKFMFWQPHGLWLEKQKQTKTKTETQ